MASSASTAFRYVLFASAAAVFGIFVGCSDPPKHPPPEGNSPVQPGTGGFPGVSTTDSGVSDAGKSDASTDAGQDAATTTCTNLANVGTIIDQVAVADDFPQGTGGIIVDGTYTVTDAKIYVGVVGQPGLTNATYQTTISIAGTAFARIQSFKSSGGVVTDSRASGTLAPNGVNGTIALACPNALQEEITFTVGTNTLTIGNVITKEVFVFTKKP